MSGLWSKLTALFRGGNNTTNKSSRGSGKKKKSSDDEVDGINQDQYKVVKAQRSYDEITIGDNREEKGTVDYTVVKKPRNYDEVVLKEDSRLSQAEQPVLNYVEVEFSNHPAKKKTVKKKDSKTEYAAITVKNKTVVVN